MRFTKTPKIFVNIRSVVTTYCKFHLFSVSKRIAHSFADGVRLINLRLLPFSTSEFYVQITSDHSFI